MEFEQVEASGIPFVASIEGDGPDVVLLHGFPDTPHTWEPLRQSLITAGYRTITPWLRGYHPDTIVAGRRYDPESYAEDAVRLLDAVGSERAVIFGHDWGAFIGYSAAAVSPERFPALITSGIAHPSLFPRNLKLLWDGRHFFVNRLPWIARTARRNDFAYFDTLYRRWAPRWSGPDRDEALARAKHALTPEETLRAAFAYYGDAPFRPEGKVAEIPRVPGLIIGGTDDDVQLEAFAETSRRMPAPSRTVIIDGGHWPHREDHETTEREMLAFLAEVQPA